MHQNKKIRRAAVVARINAKLAQHGTDIPAKLEAEIKAVGLVTQRVGASLHAAYPASGQHYA